MCVFTLSRSLAHKHTFPFPPYSTPLLFAPFLPILLLAVGLWGTSRKPLPPRAGGLVMSLLANGTNEITRHCVWSRERTEGEVGLCYSRTAAAGASHRNQYSPGPSGNSAQSKKHARAREREREGETLLGLRNSIKAKPRVCHDITVIWTQTELVTRKHGS